MDTGINEDKPHRVKRPRSDDEEVPPELNYTWVLPQGSLRNKPRTVFYHSQVLANLLQGQKRHEGHTQCSGDITGG
eukprot:CAMPEP_0113951506 /NCGR_PEP_ID=MMETSP1339-20121228/86432_1 /TAXON_ID=94617 /ORGANISM="Fibrocapsa japonica" /LENGTH=75 /DNA_ID=CAMNT_0000959783 /DNA_START=12 /DNA_END=239 /DNA_ORIENTATION=+ /assembly_acc=CAM_ASM_000762